jgi:hypothetical protein
MKNRLFVVIVVFIIHFFAGLVGYDSIVGGLIAGLIVGGFVAFFLFMFVNDNELD